MDRTLIVNDRFVMVEVADEVQGAFNDWCIQHVAELDALFEPFGLTTQDLGQPQLMQYVHAIEI